MRRKKHSDPSSLRGWKKGTAYLVLIFQAFITIFPLYIMIVTSFKENKEFFSIHLRYHSLLMVKVIERCWN